MGTPVARVDRTSNTATAVEHQFHGLASSTLAAVAQDGTINASFSYAPFGEVLEATSAGGAGSGTAAHRRRLNDKYEDNLTGLAYYGARYYDRHLIGWTQADPLYRFAPDRAKSSELQHMPRRANLYTAHGANPLRYIDPDGKDLVQHGVNLPKMVQTRDALQKLVRNNGEIRFQRIGDEGFRIRIDQTPRQRASSDRPTRDLVNIINSTTHVVIIHNLDKRKSPTQAEKREDQRLSNEFNVRGRGGAATARKTPPEALPGGQVVQARILIDYENLTPTVQGADGNEVEMTPEVAIGHELAHAQGMSEEEARAYENKELRTPRGLPLRALQ